ncbi:MAG: hypothetical protein ACREER_04690 [Alphaproteobacteria bacterium]
MTFARARALLLGVLGVLLVLGLAFVGLAAALVLVPVGLVAYLVLRYRLRGRMATTTAETFVWTSRSATQPGAAEVEGVVLDVTVEEPAPPERLDRPNPR